MRGHGPAVDLFGDPPPADSYRLRTLELYNWGPFAGLHRVEFDPRATAVIGPTGSGKTTLVDALMTLLVRSPRYNLASTGGSESDRDLVSYVRGVLQGDGVDEVLRPGATVTGLAATYENGQPENNDGHQTNDAAAEGGRRDARLVRLGAMFWMDGASRSSSDLRRRFLFSTAVGSDFESWLRVHHDEGVRGLSRADRETAGLMVCESKTQYLARVRKFFDVGDNAFTLLNRAAGLKQLNSVDEIFRELVLDDRPRFDQALKVAAEFDNLAAIHEEMVVARRQRDSLLPVRNEEATRKKLSAKVDQTLNFRRSLPVLFAVIGARLWKAERDRLATSIETGREDLARRTATVNAQQLRCDDLQEAYLRLGGNVVEPLREAIEKQEREVRRIEKNVADFRSLVRSLSIDAGPADEALTAERFRATRRKIDAEAGALETRRDEHNERAIASEAASRATRDELNRVEGDLRKVKDRPGSNLPPAYQDFRGELAAELGLPDDDLPYVAELVEVRADQAVWRGAIERAIGGERMRVLVPDATLRDALRWINSRHNRIHVRVQAPGQVRGSTEWFDDSYLHKLTFKDHRFADAVRRMLAVRDYHCVDAAHLDATDRGLTIEGTMSHGRDGLKKWTSGDWPTVG